MKRTAKPSKQGAGKRPSKHSTRSVSQSAWPRRLQDLKRFRKESGHCNVPAVYPPNRPLGRWVNYLRQQQKTGKLAKQWFACLDGLGFCWVLGRGSARRLDWDLMLAELIAFTKRHGHCNVAYNWPEDPRLGRWVARVRRKKREGKLDRRQIAQLNKLGIAWEPLPKPPWSEMYAALAEYKRVHGHCNVPYDWAEIPCLGPWIRKQRQDRRAGRLDPGRIEQLDKLGFVWNWLENQWESRYAALVEFRKEHGHCRVSTLSKTHAALGNWVRTLRVRKRQGKLSAERVGRLDALGFTWDIN
jgi:hypothetical protein